MIPKFLSCEIKPSDIDVDLECLLLNEVGSYEKIINELIYDIHEELSVEWDDIWSFDDVVERFDKGEILWLVYVMDVVDLSKYLYKKLEERQKDISFSLANGAVKDWEQYKMSVGEIRGLSFAREEIKSLLEKNVDDVEDFISS